MSGIEEWIVLSTAHIAFPPDRKPVAEEIRASYEDHRSALIEAGESEEQASRLALEALGDPNEAGELLAKIHKPWLGWAWKVSRWAVIAASILLFITLIRIMWGDLPQKFFSTSPPVPVMQAELQDGTFTMICRGTCQEKARIGQYVFRIEDAQILRYRDGGDCAFILLNVRYPFWLDAPYGLYRRFTAEDSMGQVYVSGFLFDEPPGINMPAWQPSGEPFHQFCSHMQMPGVAQYWIALLGCSAEVKWVTLKYDYNKYVFSFTVDFEEVLP